MIIYKRISSLQYNNNYIIKDNKILLKNKIIYHYFPIEKINYFSLSIENSEFCNKTWIYLILNLNTLKNTISTGKQIKQRNLIIDIVKINSKLNNNAIDKIFSNNFLTFNNIYFNIYTYDIILKSMMYFDKINIPHIYFVDNYLLHLENDILIDKVAWYGIKNIIDISCNKVYFIEDIRNKVNNFINETGHTNLEKLHPNFFIKSKKLLILTELDEIDICFLGYSKIEKLYIINEIDLDMIISFYNKYRLNNNQLLNQYILENIQEEINTPKLEFEKCNIKLNHILLNNSLRNYLNNLNLVHYRKISINEEWSKIYFNKLKKFFENKEKPESCPISMDELNKTAVKTSCGHYFNFNSIQEWLKKSNECPICRTKLKYSNFIFIEKPNFNELSNLNANILMDKDLKELVKFPTISKLDNINLDKPVVNLSCVSNQFIYWYFYNQNKSIKFLDL